MLSIQWDTICFLVGYNSIMTTLSNSRNNEQEIGAKPANITWNIVKGDSASILVSFLGKDEVTPYVTSGWEYTSKAYSSRTKTSYTLLTEVLDSSVKISALPEVTSQWGTGSNNKVDELEFDLQIILGPDLIWTPVIGTIKVIKDVPVGTL
jgi:hypothetical protein